MNDNSPDQDRYLRLAPDAFAAADHLRYREAQATMRQIGEDFLQMAPTTKEARQELSYRLFGTIRPGKEAAAEGHKLALEQ